MCDVVLFVERSGEFEYVAMVKDLEVRSPRETECKKRECCMPKTRNRVTYPCPG